MRPSLDGARGRRLAAMLRGSVALGRAGLAAADGDRGEAGGGGVVVDALTTATQLVVLNPDGSFTAELNPAPVRFQDTPAGSWVDIDVTPELAADGSVGPVASPVEVEVPADPAVGSVSVVTSTGVITMGYPDVATPAGDAVVVVDGERV